MTTMTEKLLAKAAEYEDRARSLRLAAAEMEGDAVNGKRKTAGSILDQAIALRNGQRNGNNGHASTNGHRPGHGGNPTTAAAVREQRQALIRAYLQDGPQRRPAIMQQLEAHGLGCSESHLLKLLNKTKGVALQGYGHSAAWKLKGTGDGRSNRPKTYVRVNTRAAQQATRARIFDVLGHYDRKTPKAPGDVAKALGITVAQTGLAPLVHQKYLKKHKGGYVRTAKAYVVLDEATEPAASS